MAVNKVVYVENGVQKTLVDLSADTVSAETLKKGATAHDKTGAQITGTMESSGGTDLKTMIIELEVIGDNDGVGVVYINKHKEYMSDSFSDFSSSNIVEVETVDPGFIVITTLMPFTYSNVEFDDLGSSNGWVDPSNENTYIAIFSTEHLHSLGINRVVLDFS